MNYESASFIEKERQEAYIHLAKTTLSGVEFEKHLEKAEGGRNLSASGSLKSHIISQRFRISLNNNEGVHLGITPFFFSLIHECECLMEAGSHFMDG